MSDLRKRFVIDTKVVHQWAIDEGIINEDTQMPTISFPDFIRFKIEYDPDNLEDYDSKNEASRMNDLKNAVNMFRRPPSPFIQSGEGTKIFEVIAGTENGYDDKIFVCVFAPALLFVILVTLCPTFTVSSVLLSV